MRFQDFALQSGDHSHWVSLSTKEFVTLGRSPYISGLMWESEEDIKIVEKPCGISAYCIFPNADSTS